MIIRQEVINEIKIGLRMIFVGSCVIHQTDYRLNAISG
jgi:hypothetical protein